MDTRVTGDSVDLRQKAWEEFVGRVNRLIESGELEREEIRYKLELGCEFAEAERQFLTTLLTG